MPNVCPYYRARARAICCCGVEKRSRGGGGPWRKHKVARKSLSFVESSVKGGGEADVRPHTDNSTECSVEFMRFNPLRNPREAALQLPRCRVRGGDGGGGSRPKPNNPTRWLPSETAGSKCMRKKASPGFCLTAKERALTPGNKTVEWRNTYTSSDAREYNT